MKGYTIPSCKKIVGNIWYIKYYKGIYQPFTPFTWEKKKVNKVPCVFSEYLYVISKNMIKSTIPKEIKPKVSRKAYDGGAKREYR